MQSAVTSHRCSVALHWQDLRDAIGEDLDVCYDLVVVYHSPHNKHTNCTLAA
jgi:hypothetical protein